MVPATVLDPFIGSGTTAVAAQKLGRRAVGVDASPDYLKLATKRFGAITLPMTLEVTSDPPSEHINGAC